MGEEEHRRNKSDNIKSARNNMGRTDKEKETSGNAQNWKRHLSPHRLICARYNTQSIQVWHHWLHTELETNSSPWNNRKYIKILLSPPYLSIITMPPFVPRNKQIKTFLQRRRTCHSRKPLILPRSPIHWHQSYWRQHSPGIKAIKERESIPAPSHLKTILTQPVLLRYKSNYLSFPTISYTDRV